MTSLERFKYGGYHHGVANDVKGIGKSLYDTSKKYGSNKVLKSIIHIPSIKGLNVIYHELLHQFSNNYIPTQASGHYSFTTGGVLGGFYPDTLKNLDTNIYQAHNGNGKTFNTNYSSAYYSLTDLYLMGLALKEEVPLIEIAQCYDNTQHKNGCPYWIDKNNGIFYADYIDTLVIDDLIATHGERIPSYDDSPKEFRGLVVLISSVPVELSHIEELDRLIGIITFSGYADNARNFYEATLGRANLKWDDLFRSKLNNRK